jgi:hypothetical protein
MLMLITADIMQVPNGPDPNATRKQIPKEEIEESTRLVLEKCSKCNVFSFDDDGELMIEKKIVEESIANRLYELRRSWRSKSKTAWSHRDDQTSHSRLHTTENGFPPGRQT